VTSATTEAGAVDWSRVRAVSWDVDGTLYGLTDLRRALRFMALVRAVWPSTWRDLRALQAFTRAMNDVRLQGGDLSGLRLELPRAEHAAIETRWLIPALARIGPRSGAAELRARLAARGVRQVVLSDHPAREKLRALGLEGAFEQVFEGEALGWLKPSPRLFQVVVEALGVAPDELLHVGDREDTDGAGARAAGCQSIVLAPGPTALLDVARALTS
jgi:putative hydrolase of the HAD superfamily